MEKKKQSGKAGRAYVLHIDLAGSKPAIWRKLRVPGIFTLGDLHAALQIAFGWEEDHLHSFTIGSAEYGMMSMDGMDLPDNDMADEDDFYLDDLGLKKNQTFTYLYDFGDSWEHTVRVSEIIATDEDPEIARPICIEGERAGPPEDSGGIWGYKDILEALKKPKLKKNREILEWVGDFDPEYFSLEEVNRMFKQTFKSPKKPNAAGGKKTPKH
jgi:hypothetical protein